MNLVPAITMFPEPAVICKKRIIIRDDMVYWKIMNPLVVDTALADNLFGNIKTGIFFECRPVTIVKTHLAAVTHLRMDQSRLQAGM